MLWAHDDADHTVGGLNMARARSLRLPPALGELGQGSASRAVGPGEQPQQPAEIFPSRRPGRLRRSGRIGQMGQETRDSEETVNPLYAP
jgi:hypothetical protein